MKIARSMEVDLSAEEMVQALVRADDETQAYFFNAFFGELKYVCASEYKFNSQVLDISERLGNETRIMLRFLADYAGAPDANKQGA